MGYELTIDSWDFHNKDSFGSAYPYEFVLFGMFEIKSGLNECETATATIGQRDEKGRLYQKTPGHFSYIKCMLTKDESEWQIELLHNLVCLLNDGKIDPSQLPSRIASRKAWDQVKAVVSAAEKTQQQER